MNALRVFLTLLPVFVLVISKEIGGRSRQNVTCAQEFDESGQIVSVACDKVGIFYRLKNAATRAFGRSSENGRMLIEHQSGHEPPSQRSTFLTFTAKEPHRDYNGSFVTLQDFLSLYPDSPRVAFIVHGFKTSELTSFLKIKTALLAIKDTTMRPDVVVVVDWRQLAKLKKSDLFAGYKKAAKNAETIGREIAYALHLLNVHKNLDSRKVHLIGFSLGAQAVGIAGRKAVLSYNLSKVGRITGLDPAGPRFEDFFGHLNKDDAIFVDVIHTNAGNSWFKLKMGMTKSIGHVDFFPNGGSKQPGCTKSMKDISCSHNMAVKYFEASISASERCKFYAYKCTSWEDFKSLGKKSNCQDEVVPMGFYSFSGTSQGSYYLETTEEPPYC